MVIAPALRSIGLITALATASLASQALTAPGTSAASAKRLHLSAPAATAAAAAVRPGRLVRPASCQLFSLRAVDGTVALGQPTQLETAFISSTFSDFSATVAVDGGAGEAAVVEADWPDMGLQVISPVDVSRPGLHHVATTVTQTSTGCMLTVESTLDTYRATAGATPSATPTPLPTQGTCYAAVAAQPSSMSVGTSFITTATISSTFPASDFSATISWGDHTGDTIATIDGVDPALTVDSTHTWAAPGTYQVVTTVHQFSSGCTVSVTATDVVS